jgi:4-coumarate--CoA ligase
VVLLAKNPLVDKFDLSSLRVINSGSAPLKEDLLVATYKRLGIPVKQGIVFLGCANLGYGLTETAPMVHSM